MTVRELKADMCALLLSVLDGVFDYDWKEHVIFKKLPDWFRRYD